MCTKHPVLYNLFNIALRSSKLSADHHKRSPLSLICGGFPPHLQTTQSLREKAWSGSNTKGEEQQ